MNNVTSVAFIGEDSHSQSWEISLLHNGVLFLDETSKILPKSAMERLNYSVRAYDRILKVARTIADLENVQSILTTHISEAIQYRSLDREGWLGVTIKLYSL